MKKVSFVVAVVTLLTIAQTGVAVARGGDQGDRGSQQRNAAAERSDQVRNRDRRGERRSDAVASEGRNRSGRFAQSVDNRQANQRARIQEGRESGNLSRRESGQLRQDQRKVSGMERRFESDGRFDRRERHTLKRAQDRASDRIFRAKNNDHDRGRHYGWGKGGYHDNKSHRGWQRNGHSGRSHKYVEKRVVYGQSWLK